MAIGTYAELQTAVGTNWPNRSDLSSRVPEFIALAEAELRKDERCRRLENHGDFAVDAESETLPTDLLSISSLAHNGPTYYGPIEIVGVDQLATLRGLYGPSGTPRYAAVAEGTILFAPVPQETYTLRLTYWQGVPALSDSATTNWLLTSHPDIYLYASLIQVAMFLVEDERVPMWEAKLDKSLEAMRVHNWNLQFGGGQMRRRFKAIG